MNKKRIVIMGLLILLMIGFVIGLNFKKYRQSSKNDFNIIKWDNFYAEKNINLYYGTKEKQVLAQLNSKYRVNDIIANSKDELEKSIKIMNWVRTNMKYDKNKKNKVEDKGAADILESKQKSKPYSNLEICTVFNEFCNSGNIISRIGKLTISDSTKTKDNPSFFVCEVWNVKYNKWIMIDVINGGYVWEKDMPLSTVDVIQKGICNLQIVSDESPDKYKKKMSKYFYAYTIKIDNTIYNAKQSNCYVTFINNNEDRINMKNPLQYPSIYTKNKYLFEVSPEEENKKYNSDEVPTMIFSKVMKNKEGKDNKSDKEIKEELCIGVFKNSSMEEKYYISINGSPFEEKNKYFKVQIKKGLNNIKLSKDGKTSIREVAFKYKE
ncbi:transglutaminase domain-containing protein [Clostridium botulinum D/C]|uniref:transglutaminase-like domain-containing protein n=1 Tax=Clostridium botulinum TaxID=1491 RepID=UPI001E659F9A|nr:transglutaminase-like domain-containing protein [Clostridium botulinum]MCD3352194.1 transglutaminase domain-containing protein [Clostridium botulinum D/C]MCD3361153.1 transglutaminase domain-containing protein [Clostridium botulinum D/C]MCD3363694.1 transglutaminase domain-containing protein [Clostridium botulinum D/C]MCD3366900.1 transglutaminase domain-containing protein [Clostridium botulinum D/C]